MKRDLLERDRLKILDDLDKVRNGDMTALRKNEASRWVASDILARQPTAMAVDINKVKLDPLIKDKLLSDEVRIKALRDQREKTLREFVPEAEELDPLTRTFQDPPRLDMTSSPLNFYRTEEQPAGPRTMPSP